MATLADLQAAGYTVAEAFTRPDGKVVYSYSGPGVPLSYLVDNDQATINALIEPGALAARVAQDTLAGVP